MTYIHTTKQARYFAKQGKIALFAIRELPEEGWMPLERVLDYFKDRTGGIFPHEGVMGRIYDPKVEDPEVSIFSGSPSGASSRRIHHRIEVMGPLPFPTKDGHTYFRAWVQTKQGNEFYTPSLEDLLDTDGHWRYNGEPFKIAYDGTPYALWAGSCPFSCNKHIAGNEFKQIENHILALVRRRISAKVGI